MNVLIIYDSKYGTTKRAAQILAQIIDNSKVISIDTFDETDKNYDVIILGTRVYQDKVSVKMLEFVQAHEAWLKTKLVFAYVMMLEGDSGAKYLKPIKDILGESLISMKSFGGQLILEKLDEMDYKAIKKQLDEMGIPLKNINMMNEEEIKKHGKEINEKIHQLRESRLDDELIIALAETYLRQHRLCIVAGHESGRIWQKQFDYVYD
ncbi:MAG: flavodoxin family protein, partial [Turicibacter sp.]